MTFSPPEIYPAQKSGASSLTSKSKVTKKKKKKTRRRARRSYNPIATRAKALEILRRNSETLCELAGLQPILDGTTFTFNDAEETEEIEEIFDEIEYCESQLTSNGLVYESDDIDEEYSQEEINQMPVDIETFRTLWLSYVDEGDYEEFTSGGIHKRTLMKVVLGWLGTPYRFGGTSRSALDCSAFSRSSIAEACNISIPRTARTQFLIGEPVHRTELEFGDLIFFHTYSYSYASHVGIYLADGLFVHSSSRYGVTITSLNTTYYSTHFIGARRLYLNNFDDYMQPMEVSSTGK
jgi:cell wall-associated NlpC family hydrolase